MQWNEIEADRISLSPERTKTATAHLIPLTSLAKSIIETIPQIEDSRLVFTTNGKTPISGWTNSKRDLDRISGVKDWRLHDLRRTVATGLQKLGIPLQVTEAVLGHTSGSRAGVVGIYRRHDFLDEKFNALEHWSEHLRSL